MPACCSTGPADTRAVGCPQHRALPRMLYPSLHPLGPHRMIQLDQISVRAIDANLRHFTSAFVQEGVEAPVLQAQLNYCRTLPSLIP